MIDYNNVQWKPEINCDLFYHTQTTALRCVTWLHSVAVLTETCEGFILTLCIFWRRIYQGNWAHWLISETEPGRRNCTNSVRWSPRCVLAHFSVLHAHWQIFLNGLRQFMNTPTALFQEFGSRRAKLFYEQNQPTFQRWQQAVNGLH